MNKSILHRIQALEAIVIAHQTRIFELERRLSVTTQDFDESGGGPGEPPPPPPPPPGP